MDLIGRLELSHLKHSSKIIITTHYPADSTLREYSSTEGGILKMMMMFAT